MTQRKCGGCTLCCRLLPVHEGVKVEHAYRDADIQLGYKLNELLPKFDKAAGERCQHQCSRGCRIHGTNRMPIACRAFECAWLANLDMHDQHRPDRVGYVIDPVMDTIQVDGERLQVIQVWVDPERPEAPLKDPMFKRYMKRREKDGVGFILRYNEKDAQVLLPPRFFGDWAVLPRHEANVPLGAFA